MLLAPSANMELEDITIGSDPNLIHQYPRMGLSTYGLPTTKSPSILAEL